MSTTDEVAEAFAATNETWRAIIQTTRGWGLGRDLTEAYANLPAYHQDEELVRSAEFDRDVKIVVDVFGRIYWSDPDAVVEWTGSQNG